MKRGFFLLSLMPLFITFLVKAQEIKQEKKVITTAGEATVWVNPDRARIFLGIETLQETIDAAHKENAAKMKKAVAALKALKIKEMLIKAPGYNVSLVKEPTYEAAKAGRLPKIIGYKVTQNFTVLLKNKDPLILSKNASYVIDTALRNGVNIIEKVVFFKEDDSQERRKALKLAVKDAISNAKAIAEAAGVSVKSYTLISTSTYYWQPPQIAQMTQAFTPQEAGRATTTLIAGKIPIFCKVQLHCITE